MTCHDARERLSAYLDDALAPDERRDVAAHLEGCAECRRELARLDATVALLRRVEPARAPVGFVDRVVEAARPRPWYRRAAAAIFLPFSVKLPAEATALLMVALLAVYVFERTPALQESARRLEPARETPAASPPVAVAPPPAAPEALRKPAREQKEREPASEAERQTLKDARRDEGARPGGVSSSSPAPASPPRIPAPAAPAPVQAPPAASAPPVAAPPAAAPPAGGGSRPEPSPAAPRATAPPAPAPVPRAKAEAPAESRAGENRHPSQDVAGSTASQRLEAKRAAPADVVARIAVRDRDAAEADLTALIGRVAGREIGRRREDEATVVEAIVPQARYAEFTQGLSALGTWKLEADRPDLPAEVRVILRLQ